MNVSLTVPLRENVVSLARNIGYVPRSSVDLQSVVNFSVGYQQMTQKY